MIKRSLFFIILLFIAVGLPWWVLLVCVLLYIARYTAYELIILALFLDTLYGLGTPMNIPYYTIAVSLLMIVVEWIKPRILMYNQ